jgi:hypothetical protein
VTQRADSILLVGLVLHSLYLEDNCLLSLLAVKSFGAQ